MQPEQQSQRVWVITGANSGLGLAITSTMLRRGDRVIATVRSMSKFPNTLREQGAHALLLDLSRPDDEIRRAAEAALQVYGHVDVLVNNAGWAVPCPWEEADLDEVRAQFQTLFFGTIAFTQALLPHFRTRRTGHILNVSSAGSFLTLPGWGAYACAKAALNVFTDTLHGEMKHFGVQVLTILPGYFPTAFMSTMSGKPSYRLSEVYTDKSQGHDAARNAHQSSCDAGKLGDPDKLAARIYEVVTKTGMAESLVMKEGPSFAWTLIPLGADCDEHVREKLESMLDNVNGTEPIWRSVNMDAEQQRLVPRDLAPH